MFSTLFKNKSQSTKSNLEAYFEPFRTRIIGNDMEFNTPYGRQKLLYADWTASGRMYEDIETIFQKKIYPLVANTHTETNTSGSCMTKAYAEAKSIIKAHVNAKDTDILISSNSGMTGVVNKFQRILGLKIHEKFRKQITLAEDDRPIVFITHMEHHSNQTSWLETIADVAVIAACPEGRVCLDSYQSLLDQYKNRKHKIAAITSCSNVTGIKTPYEVMAKMIHEVGGYCFVDFACAAPYIEIDMHPEDPLCALDAIYFSPHKFLGGPSSAGVLLFNHHLYNNRIPDNPGGGTVDWTNPWGEHKYHDAIEAREDGGTPAFLQTMRTALSIKLKEAMGIDAIYRREKEICDSIWKSLEGIKNLHILAENNKERLPVFSFYIDDLHYNLGVKLLNDRFGIQVRGGCSCAGTYGHYLLDVSKSQSKSITDQIDFGDLANKPGWIRASFHPTMLDSEIITICDAIKSLAENHKTWATDYIYDSKTNDFAHHSGECHEDEMISGWFDL